MGVVDACIKVIRAKIGIIIIVITSMGSFTNILSKIRENKVRGSFVWLSIV